MPSSNLRNRVCTLPRRSLITRSGRCSLISAWRRKEEVPTTAPWGNLASEAKWLETNASVGSSLGHITVSPRPSGNSIGTSFIECTAISARFSRIATSSSLTNSPLPPILDSGESSSMSPLVVMPINSTIMPG
ncbi:MAG: hypothetical protein OFPII_38060 [Osedax symbiont Rs1]|nr:MAG: hypothetical protein OFPII_38060 [Osedax symbiont Rs1]